MAKFSFSTTKQKALFLILAVLLVSAFLFRNDITGIYYDFFQKLPETRKIVSNLLTKEINKRITDPEPLRFLRDSPTSLLTKEGVFEWTNSRRKEGGVPLLVENENLNIAAKAKVQDMFEKQYFAHVSPLGKGAGDLAEKAGYKFISIGENLALGNFENDEQLVQGWMDSPGHRANILNGGYSEIGIAVGKGVFEGRQTWLAVQIFGKPLSSCPQPDEKLAGSIENFKVQLENLQTIIESMLLEIESTRPKRGPAYTEKVNSYNDFVGQYNQLIAETENLISQYNGQVKSFNNCVNQ